MKGHKRHLLVDTTGMILHVLVHEANIQDQEGSKQFLGPLTGCLPRLGLIWADSAYRRGGFIEWEKIRPSGFHVRKLALDRGTLLRLALHLASARPGL